MCLKDKMKNNRNKGVKVKRTHAREQLSPIEMRRYEEIVEGSVTSMVIFYILRGFC